MTAPTATKWTAAELKEIADPLAKKLQDTKRKLTVIEERSAWHANQYKELSKRWAAADEGVKKLKTLANQSKDPSKTSVNPKQLAVEVNAIAAGADTALAKKRVITYYYGKTKVAGESAIEAKARAALPKSDEKHATQAVHDAVNGSNAKDAAVGGKGVKHASAGIKGVGSCSIFFTYEEHMEGLERRFVVVAVGGHAGPSTYQIYESFTPNLRKGAKVSL